jgi:hypothetical protein
MPTIKHDLSLVSDINKEFAGTVAFKNEKICLPDGSKVAIGMDGPLWVIVYQEAASKPFVVCEYNVETDSVIIDKKTGTLDDLEKVKEWVNFFFEHAEIDDLITIESEEIRA